MRQKDYSHRLSLIGQLFSNPVGQSMLWCGTPFKLVFTKTKWWGSLLLLKWYIFYRQNCMWALVYWLWLSTLCLWALVFLHVVYPTDSLCWHWHCHSTYRDKVNHNKIRTRCEMRDVLILNEGIKGLPVLFFSGCSSYMEKEFREYHEVLGRIRMLRM